MDAWVEHVAISLLQQTALVLAALPWFSFWTCTTAKAVYSTAEARVPWRGIWLSLAVAVPLIAGAVTVLHLKPCTDLLGLHFWKVCPPLTWWLWGGLLAGTPGLATAKVLIARPLIRDQAWWQGAPVLIEPRWAGMLAGVADAVTDGTNYGG